MSLLVATLAATALAAPTHAQLEAASWSSIGSRAHADAGTVQLYSAPIGGLTCLKGSASVAVPPATLLAVASDIPSATRWSTAGLTRSELLSKSGSTLQYWQYLDIPAWTMASDRFWFLQSTIGTSGNLSYLKWSPLPAGHPHAAKVQAVRAEHPDAVEPAVNVGGWYFKANGATTTVDYLVCTDPGGSIPAAVQSAAERRTLPDTVGDLVREAKRRAGS
jgi:hypothetical protein